MKVAACLAQGAERPADIVARMCQAQCLAPLHRSRVFPIEGGALGAVFAADQYAPFPLAYQSASGNVLLVTGVPVAWNQSLEAVLTSVVARDCATATATLRDLDGPFAALFWDNANRKLAIVTDFLGVQSLYQVRRPGTFLLATELKGLAASGVIALADVALDREREADHAPPRERSRRSARLATASWGPATAE